MADSLFLGTLPLAPSLKKGGGMSSDSPSERRVLKDSYIEERRGPHRKLFN
jgi:hypothetical protein